jgi:2-phospho-L-lactate/phosphoenolpyruvate guanylyltransferase
MPMNKPLAILPIKSFDQAKQRLRDALDPVTRRVLAEAMFSDVLVALRRSKEIDRVLVISNDHGAQRIAAGYGALVLEDQDRGHNQAAMLGLRHAREMQAPRALLVPGDCPLLDPAELDALITRAAGRRSAVIVPDRHGTGTNALLLSPPEVLEPAFGPGSCERHETLARSAGLEVQTIRVASLGLDVDTPEDLAEVEARLASSRGGAAHTRGMLRQMART